MLKLQERGLSLQLVTPMQNEEMKKLVGELAKALWATFEYGLPNSPLTMANFIVTQIQVAGYQITKKPLDASQA